MELSKTIYNYAPKSKSMVELLKTLNVPDYIVFNGKKGGFWVRVKNEDLEFLLNDIKSFYIKRITENHPDKGGSLEQSTIINSAWEEIKNRFNSKIKPELQHYGFVNKFEETENNLKITKKKFNWDAAKKRRKKIKQIDAETGQVIKNWDSIREAAISVVGKIKGSTCIIGALKGKYKTAYGYKWEYLKV